MRSFSLIFLVLYTILGFSCTPELEERETQVAVRQEAPSPPLPSFFPIADQIVDEMEAINEIVLKTKGGKASFYKCFHKDNTCSQLTNLDFDETKGILNWTPSYDQAGSHQFRITAKINKLEIQTSFTITVNNVNRAPALVAIADQTIKENEALAEINAGDNSNQSDTDMDGEALAYSCEVIGQDSCEKISGITFTKETGVMNWTPGFEQAGNYQIKITASDGELADEESFLITVSNVNRAPALAEIASQAVNEQQAITEINANDLNTTGDTDIDGETLTYSCHHGEQLCTTLSGLTFDTATGVLNWTPTFRQLGSHELIITASDGELSSSQSFKIDVTISNNIWISGSQYGSNFAGRYGERGTAHKDNQPGARCSMSYSQDSNGTFYLFGGAAYDEEGTFLNTNDLWKFDKSSQQWTWLSGDKTGNQKGVYASLGAAHKDNKPGSRNQSISFFDSEGNFYLWGGTGYDMNGDQGVLNDFWKYSPVEDLWTWIGGGTVKDQSGDYGTINVAHADRQPGGREGVAYFLDGDGNFYLFGGYGLDSSSTKYYLNDIWKYDFASGLWTWIAGDNPATINATYGSKGVAHADNQPGGRTKMAYTMDSSGDLLIFGGTGYDSASAWGYLNDLWKFDVSEKKWTWIAGDNTINTNGVYGSKGVADSNNKPGGRHAAVISLDENGDIFVFGGEGRDKDGSVNRLNDLWKYDFSEAKWIWMTGNDTVNQSGIYGSKGVAHQDNTPGSRYSPGIFKGNGGDFYLFGGCGVNGEDVNDRLNDLWQYDVSENRWIWLKGESTQYQPGVYGTKGVAHPDNQLGIRSASTNIPMSQGELILFGGIGHDSAGTNGILNDLWKYNIKEHLWTWVSGDNTVGQSGVYGTKGVAHQNNKPGGRSKSALISAGDHFYLFGGLGYDSAGTSSQLNDLWKYNQKENLWTWISGNNIVGNSGVYGTKGVAHKDNQPGARYGMVNFSDSTGNIYIFGGLGYDSVGVSGILNDLWKYSPKDNLWTWMSGDNLADQSGVYGTKSVAHQNNKPGGRFDHNGILAQDGIIYIFGGKGYDSAGTNNRLNDLWKYDPKENLWTWVSGDNLVSQTGVYGTKGVAHQDNKPGARRGIVSFIDGEGNLYIFGGNGHDGDGVTGRLNDLWKYNPKDNLWTWIAGDKTVNEKGIYGTKGTAHINNKPGGRNITHGFSDQNGHFYLFGGFGYDQGGYRYRMNDLWILAP